MIGSRNFRSYKVKAKFQLWDIGTNHMSGERIYVRGTRQREKLVKGWVMNPFDDWTKGGGKNKVGSIERDKKDSHVICCVIKHLPSFSCVFFRISKHHELSERIELGMWVSLLHDSLQMNSKDLKWVSHACILYHNSLVKLSYPISMSKKRESSGYKVNVLSQIER